MWPFSKKIGDNNLKLSTHNLCKKSNLKRSLKNKSKKEKPKMRRLNDNSQSQLLLIGVKGSYLVRTKKLEMFLSTNLLCNASQDKQLLSMIETIKML